MGFDSMLHDGQKSFNKAGDTRSAADVLHCAVHVVRTGGRRDKKLNKPCTCLCGCVFILGLRCELDKPVFHSRLQVEMGVNRSQPLYDMNTQPLEHLGKHR